MSKSSSQEQLRLFGYTGDWTYRPGDAVHLHVSSEEAMTYRASIVRLRQGDPRPHGPGYRETHVADLGTFEAVPQPTYTGSYVRVAPSARAVPGPVFTIGCWLWPSAPASDRRRGVVSRRDPDSGVGFSLHVNADRTVGIWLSDGSAEWEATSETPLQWRNWTFVGAVVDTLAGSVRLFQLPAKDWLSSGRTEEAFEFDSSTAPSVSESALTDVPLLIGALSDRPEDHYAATGIFVGKLASPFISESHRDVAAQASTDDDDDGLIARWEFSAEVAGPTVVDAGPHGLHGVAINLPARAIPGPHWSMHEVDFRCCPAEFDAIHFHSDDLEDVGWPEALEWVVPEDLASGAYGVRLESDASRTDVVPFFVVPGHGQDRARIAMLMPTLSFQVYTNERIDEVVGEADDSWTDLGRLPSTNSLALMRHPEFGRSQYDRHEDGSGVFYASSKRPALNIRPDYLHMIGSFPEHLGASLYTVDWLDEFEYRYDVITDHQLHRDGSDELAGYDVVITGAHPEYSTIEMNESLERFVATGGRLMYLGGNGYWWVTSIDEGRPHVCEVRRGPVDGTWASDPGELNHSTTGETGGLWRNRGWDPARWLGVSYLAAGFSSRTPPYKIAEQLPPEYDFVFEGIDRPDAIGDAGYVMNGAASYEIDRVFENGSQPPGTVVLASASGYDEAHYSQCLSRAMNVNLHHQADTLRCDLALYTTNTGGAVFSASAIGWSAGLAIDGYDNAASIICCNVLDRFLDRAPVVARG